jgi:hypothetical protein
VGGTKRLVAASRAAPVGRVTLDGWKLFTGLLAILAAHIAYQQYRLQSDVGRHERSEARRSRFSAYLGASHG